MNSVNIEINEFIHYTNEVGRRRSAMNRAKTIGIWVLTVLLTGIFLMAGGAKLLADAQMVENFQAWGYPDWFRALVGGAEVGAAVLLLFPRTAAPAAAILCLIMVGAVDTHLRWQEYIEASVPFILGTLCAVLAVVRHPGVLNVSHGLFRIYGRNKSQGCSSW
jgi:putative oxidoreductase